MHDSFFGFYPPTPQEYDRLWKEGLIVFDTNALLDLYRLPPTAREELFKALEFFQERVWIPYQVGLEFQRNRFSVILEQKKLTAAALTDAEKLIAGLRGRINALKLHQHGIDFDPMSVLKKLDDPISDISDAIKRVQAAELDVSASDPIRERLDKIFEKRVGVGPATQDELDELSKDSDARFSAKIPPGFADEKSKDGRTFIHDQLLYKNALGDLVLWRQLLAHVKANKIKCVMLITSDQKEDWWWKEGHKVIGPHQELMREIKRVSEVELFWMYTSDSFLKLSSTYGNQSVTDEAVAELSQLVQRIDAEREQAIDESNFSKWLIETGHGNAFSDDTFWSAVSNAGKAIPESGDVESWMAAHRRQLFPIRSKRAIRAARTWLGRNRPGIVGLEDGILQAIGQIGDERIGYNIMESYSLLRGEDAIQRIVKNIDKKVGAIKENELDWLSLVIITDPADFFLNDHKLAVINSELHMVLKVFGIKELTIGSVDENRFAPFFTIENHGQ
jgi:hypothetical protein